MPIDDREQKAKQIKTGNLPFRGGANTYLEPEQLESGQYSDAQNVRNTHPGMKKRPGQQRLHSTAEGSNSFTTLFQFSKGKRAERHFYTQKSDGYILEGLLNPPASITGSFGSIVFTEGTSPKPAAWTVITDKMLFTNGVDIPQIYPGIQTPVEKFIVCKDTEAHPILPEKGEDYSLEVMDDDTATVAPLNGLGTYAEDFDGIYVMVPMPAKALNWALGSTNSTGASMSMDYFNGAFVSITSLTNLTSLGSCAFGQDGSMAWTPPTDEITKQMYGTNGYWYRFYNKGGSCSNVCNVRKVTYDASFQPIKNVWDGIPANPVMAQVFIHASTTNASDVSGSVYSISWPSMRQTMPYDAVILSSLTVEDKIYIATIDPVEAFYVDMGTMANSHSLCVSTIGMYCGAAWSNASDVVDGTQGYTKSGWITFKRHTSVQPVQFDKLLNYAYWYYLQTSGNSTSSNLVVGFQAQPFFSITDLGKGLAVTAWKDRACYVFDKTPNFIHVSETNQPLHLNGTDYVILKAGDGRTNKIICLKNFFNEMMAWQEEKGVEGGCLTLFEGYSPDTFGKLVLSNRIGTFSPKSAVIIDGVLTSTRTDEKVQTLAYFLSHYGIFATDGRTIYAISDDIQNYFDPTRTECIKLGYEDKMWIGYDSAFNVLRVGLVSGSSATSCNIFPVYDLVDRKWTFDTLGQALNCYMEAEAGSGNIPLIQVGGGTDGSVYRLNTTQNDVTTAIDTYVRQELNVKGYDFMVKNLTLRHQVQTAGNISIIPFQNGVEKTSFVVTMVAENTGETIKKMKKTVDILGNNVAFKFGNASLTNDMLLYDIAYDLEVFDDR